jgi:tetratricopeptide (TPR) repeat protein
MSATTLLPERSRLPRPSRRPARRWLVPPAMMSDPGEELSDLKILGEHPREDAVLLWSLVRDLVLWGTAPSASRSGLFDARSRTQRVQQLRRSSLSREVTTCLDVLVSLLHTPTEPGVAVVTEVCHHVVQWAAANRKPETALAYAQAAALAEPMDARAAALVGRTAAAFGRLVRADSWFVRTVAIGRMVGDWRSYVASYHAMGEVALRRGRTDDAEAKFRKALRGARRHGYRDGRAVALIGLLRAAIEAGRMEDAASWEARAARAVRGDEALQVALAEAAVDLWMWKGEYRRALQCLQTVRLGATTPGERMVVWARIAHAAAGEGDREGLIEAWTRCWPLAAEAGAERDARFRAFLELHRAAALGGDGRRAGRAMQAAMQLAVDAADLAAISAARSPVRRAAGRVA